MPNCSALCASGECAGEGDVEAVGVEGDVSAGPGQGHRHGGGPGGQSSDGSAAEVDVFVGGAAGIDSRGADVQPSAGEVDC